MTDLQIKNKTKYNKEVLFDNQMSSIFYSGVMYFRPFMYFQKGLQWSLGKYFGKGVLDVLLLQIINKPNLTIPYLTY